MERWPPNKSELDCSNREGSRCGGGSTSNDSADSGTGASLHDSEDPISTHRDEFELGNGERPGSRGLE